MKSIAVLSLCIVGVMSYGYAPQRPSAPAPNSPPQQPAYGGYGNGMNQGSSSSGSFNNQPMELLNNMKSQSSSSGFSGSSAPVGQIVRLHHEIRENSNNNVQYETSNGIRSADNTQILPGTPNPENPSELWNKIAKSGFYAYTSPEGVPVEIHWTADGVNGFRATGNAIPTPPPVPMA